MINHPSHDFAPDQQFSEYEYDEKAAVLRMYASIDYKAGDQVF